jgi:hypothetical protein
MKCKQLGNTLKYVKSLYIMEIKIKTTMRFQLTQIRMSQVKKKIAGMTEGKGDLFFFFFSTVDKNSILYSHCRKQNIKEK